MYSKIYISLFGELLRAARKSKNHTQIELAEALNKCTNSKAEAESTRYRISNWERGIDVQKIKLYECIALCDILDVDMDYLLGILREGIFKRDTADVCDVTGLSVEAVENLIKFREAARDTNAEDIYLISLSKALANMDFLNSVAAIMNIHGREPGYHYSSTYSPDTPFYNCQLSPDSYRAFLASQLLIIIDAIATDKEAPVGTYLPYYEHVEKIIEEYRAKGIIQNNGDGGNGKETGKR